MILHPLTNHRFPHRLIIMVALVSLQIIGCAGSRGAVRSKGTFPLPAAPSSGAEYRLGPGDELRLYSAVSPADTNKSHTVQRGDQLSVTFYSNPELDRTVTILPDGTIQIPPKAARIAAGKTIAELCEEIEADFTDVINEPLVFIKPVTLHQTAERMVQALRSAGTDGTVLTVTPDGFISLPFCDSVFGAGRPAAEVFRDIEQRYRSRYPGATVSVALSRPINDAVFIFGEVRKPGAFSPPGALTVVSALARAEVSMDVAGLRSVLLMSRSDAGHATARLVNVARILRSGNYALDVPLRQYDVIFVPKKPIARAGLFVRQYINDMIPQVFRIGIGLNEIIEITQ